MKTNATKISRAQLSLEKEAAQSDKDEKPTVTKKLKKSINYSLIAGAGAAITIPVLATASGMLYWQHQKVQSIEKQRAAILDATSQGAEAILSFNAQTVEADTRRAKSLTTGEFAKTYQKLIEGSVIPAAKSKNLHSTTKISGTSMVSFTDSTATTLVFVNQSATPGTGETVTTSTAIRVKLVKIQGKWKIEAFQPI